jgi:competence protein ComFC
VVKCQPRRILGRWREGYALDVHTLSSIPLGSNEFGHMQFDTKRSELGELLYRLKYGGDQSVVAEIADAAAEFIGSWKVEVDIIVPVPPSNPRTVQPVMVLAKALSERLQIPLADCVKRTREAPQLKNVYDTDQRLQLLNGLHEVDPSATQGKRIMLFDDLYRSGATMNVIAEALSDPGKAAEVVALTITQTRSHQ